MSAPADAEERLCALEQSLGRTVRCPGGACAFWLDAPGVGLCLLQGAEASFGRRPDLARHLLEVRGALEEQAALLEDEWAGVPNPELAVE